MQSSYTKNNISDYIGKKFGHLTVIGQSEKSSKFSNKFEFQCDCGNVISEVPSRVLSGHKKSCCKCHYKNSNSELENKIKSMIGTKIGMLEIKGVSKIPKSNQTYVECLCDCGNTINVLPNSLFNNGKTNCGCAKLNNPMLANNNCSSVGTYKDGRTKHALYGTWFAMIERCEKQSHINYKYYGGRGIKVCKEWHDFWKFVEWSDSVGGRPKGYTLDRKDNNGNYEPSNCRWADRKTQDSNKSSNTIIEYNGVSKTLSEWAEELNINLPTLSHRINRGWTVERAFTEKVLRNPHKNRCIPVICLNLDGTVHKVYENFSSIPSEFSKPKVSSCCHGKKKTHRGFIWKYAEGE